MTEERARADDFVQMCFDTVAIADQEHPLPLRNRAEAIDRELMRLLKEAHLGMKKPNISTLMYNIRVRRFTRMVQNLFHNWSDIRQRIAQLNKLQLKYDKLLSRTSLLSEMIGSVERRKPRKNGFQCADKLEAVKGLLDGLRVPAESGVTKSQQGRIEAAKERGLNLIQEWQGIMGQLRRLESEAEKNDDPKTSKVLSYFFEQVESGAQKPGLWGKLSNPRLEDVIFVAYVASLAVLLLVLLDMISLLVWYFQRRM